MVDALTLCRLLRGDKGGGEAQEESPDRDNTGANGGLLDA
jgi:hypothetical protein